MNCFPGGGLHDLYCYAEPFAGLFRDDGGNLRIFVNGVYVVMVETYLPDNPKFFLAGGFRVFPCDKAVKSRIVKFSRF